MENALNNQHYKTIWEKVIMTRHQKAKSIKEALEIESDYFGSVSLVQISENGQHWYHIEGVHIMKAQCKDHYAYYLETNDCKVDCIYTGWDKKIGRIDCYDIRKTFGRPITLEDVLVLLTKSGEQYTYPDIYQALQWQLTKPLHEQSFETWELIAEQIKGE